MPEAVIVAAARSPIGRAFKGSLTTIRPDDLTVQMVRAALAQVPQLDPTEIDDLVLGCGLPGGEQGFNMARVVAVLLGLRHAAGHHGQPVLLVVAADHAHGDARDQGGRGRCVRLGRRGDGLALRQGQLRLVARHAQPDLRRRRGPVARTSRRTAPTTGAIRAADEHLPDIYIAMGQTAENLARLKGVTREDMDHFGVRSQNLAEKAIANGFFAREITPVTLPDGTVVSADDGPRAGVTYEAVSQLKPVFRPDGRVTAGNCCPLNDGAAALVVMSDTKAAELGITPLARVVSTGVSGLSPEIMGLGPVEASKQALARAGMTIDDIDLVEINEAFAAQVLPSARDLGIDEDRLNVNGGAIALGHPFGMTGARITTTLLNGAPHARQDDRPRDDVRRRRAGHGDGARAAQLTRRATQRTTTARHPPLQKGAGPSGSCASSCADSSADSGSRCRATPGWSSARRRCTTRGSPGPRPGWPGRPGRSRAAG